METHDIQGPLLSGYIIICVICELGDNAMLALKESENALHSCLDADFVLR